jgi:hypothetical protein
LPEGLADMWLNDCDVNYWLGEKELNGEGKIRLFPNPSVDGTFFLRSDKEELNGKIQVYSILGDLIVEKKIIDPGQEAIDLSGYPQGIYVARYLGKDKILQFELIKSK